MQLENLAREVGIDLSTWAERPLAQCDGQIVTTFRDLKSAYEKLRADRSTPFGASSTLEAVVGAAHPSDFQYPIGALPLDKLRDGRRSSRMR